jgi:type II secretory pathway component GspD/PulD (secretin)
MKSFLYTSLLFSLLSAPMIPLTVNAAAPATAIGLHKVYYKDAEVTQIIEYYSKISGQKFVVDAGVRGKVSIFNQTPVSTEEFFNHLSSALALNGYAINRQGDTMIVRSARNAQRDLLEVSSETPALKPERMYTFIYTPKNITTEMINRELRIFSSKDGEMSVTPRQLIITDWVSNLHRVIAILKEIDVTDGRK